MTETLGDKRGDGIEPQVGGPGWCTMRLAIWTFVALGVCSASASAEPLVFWGARLSLSGFASGTLAPEDEGYFNYTGYETNVLRRFRASLSADLALSGSVSVLTEVRTDNLAVPKPYALYLRVRPWAKRSFDVQAGLIPPVFGAFARRQYPADNPLPGMPLAYQYLTSLRSDAIPENAEGLVAMRGRGWKPLYPVGNTSADAGVPLVAAEEWDIGVEARVGRRPLSLAMAVTRGSLSDPGRRTEALAPQVSGRLVWSPVPAFALGLSGSRGTFLAREVTSVLPTEAKGDWRQEALGADVEISRRHVIVRAEAVYTRHHLPPLQATRLEDPLESLGAYGEVRWKLLPGLYIAGRADRLSFLDVSTAAGRVPWEAAVTRVEAGVGYTVRPGVLLKAAWQHDERDGGRVRKADFAVGQVVLWF